jgi:hypothetical protein
MNTFRHRACRPFVALVAAGALAFAGALVVARDASADNSTGGWSKPTQVEPVVGGDTLTSCASDGYCVALDAHGQAKVWDGVNWSAGPSVPTGAYLLSAVSCVSAQFCVAVGGYSTDPNQYDVAGGGYAWVFDGAMWSGPVVVDADQELATISCGAVTLCVATDNDSGAGYNTYTFNGASWSAPTAFFPGVSNIGLFRVGVPVSCISATFCLAVASQSNVEWAHHTISRTFDGSTWSAPINIAGSHYVQGLSCTSPTWCLALEQDDQGADSITQTFDGTSWSTAAAIAGASSARSLSCLDSTYCVALDLYGYAFTFDGASWSAPVGVRTPTTQNTVGESSITCAAGPRCLAVFYNTTATRGVSEVATFNAGLWTQSSVLYTAQGNPNLVSCSSPTFCLLSDQHGWYLTYDGTHWSAPAQSGVWTFTALSCVSATFCMGLSGSGGAYRYDGTGWTAAGPAVSGSALSCVSPMFCMAVSNNQAFVYDGTGWATAGADPSGVYNPDDGSGAFVYAASCPTATFCVIGDSAGDMWTWSGGSTWSAGGNVGIRSVLSVSCPVTTFCAIGDFSGGVVTGQPGAWSPGTVLDAPTQYSSLGRTYVSCAAAYDCHSVDLGGKSSTFDGTSWSTPIAIDNSGSDLSGSISCPTSTFCVAVEAGGGVVMFTGAVDGTGTPTPTPTSSSSSDSSSPSSPPPSPSSSHLPQLRVHAPGTTRTYAGMAVTLVTRAGDAAGALSYAAAGLPDGTRLDAATGTITGAPTRPGHYAPVITVTELSSHRTASASFTWIVSLHKLIAPKATIDGEPTHGRVVKAATGQFTADSPHGAAVPVHIHFQWYLNDKAVPGASGSAFAIPNDAKGKRLFFIATVSPTPQYFLPLEPISSKAVKVR